ncbi:nucleotidyltransferase family protein [Luteococcus sp. H138]|uniref:nucleotidyltransferase family protein n=1 Tax=unclassified Luteococcus TaxID=2639923 RepID=UPI00313CF54F
MSESPQSTTSQPPRKAVIMARGLGTRLRRAADATLSEDQQRIAALGLKAMMPLGAQGRPFVEHLISALADAGLTDICLVIGPEHDLVREHFAALETSRVRISFAVQAEPLGTADAVAAAKDFAGDDRFVVVNSDNYYPADSLRALVAASGTATLGFDAAELVARSNIPAERVAAFAILDTDDARHLIEMIEKPDPQVVAQHGPHALVSMNCFLFGPSIFTACAGIERSPRGEFEIVDAVRFLVRSGEPVTVVPVVDGVLDMSGRGDVAAVAEALADKQVAL